MATKGKAGRAAGQKRPSRMMKTSKKAAVRRVYHRSIGSNSSPLLKLPPEIRNRIYGYVLGGKDLHVKISFDTLDAKVAEQKIEVTICSAATDDDSAAAEIRNADDSIEISDWFERHQQCAVHHHSRIDREAARSRGDPSPVPFSAALLQTCSQIHSEAALLPFQTNKYLFRSQTAFYAFDKILMPVQKRAIAALSFEGEGLRGPGSSRYAELTVIKNFTGLKKLIVFNIEAWPYLPDFQAIKNMRSHFGARLEVFKPLSLETASICIHRRRGYNQPLNPGTSPARADPAMFNDLSQELETMLIADPESGDVEGGIEKA